MQRCSDAEVAAEIRRRWPEVAGIVAVREGRLTAHVAPEASDTDATSQAHLAIGQVEWQIVNPALLSLTGGRGDLDMGGPPYFLLLCDPRRGLLLYALADGHLALSMGTGDGLAALANDVLTYLRGAALVRAGQTGPLSADITSHHIVPRPGQETRWYDWFRGGATHNDADTLRACRALDPGVRYVALVDRGALVAMCSRMGPVSEASDMAASDRFEETVVNPAALALTAGAARMGAWGEPPCLIVRYPGLYAVVVPTRTGHITLSVDRSADPMPVAHRAMAWVASMTDTAPTGVP